MSSRQMVDKSVVNILWSYLSFVSTKALNLISIIIVARYLSPAEFGVMAFGLIVIGYFEHMQGFGLGAYLISTRDDIAEAAEAVFAFAVSVSALLFMVMWFGSDTLAGWLDQPELGDILRFLSIALLIESAASVHSSLLQRDLKFRLKIFPEVARGLVKGLLSITLAIMGYGVWSLAYGYVAGTAAWTLVLLVMRPWRPRRLPRLPVLLGALRYGGNILIADLCNTLRVSLDSIMVGKILGPAALGLFAVAQRMPALALKTFSVEATKVIHPVMSQMQADKSMLQTYYYGLVRYQCLLMLSAGVTIALMTEPLITLLYTQEWRGVIAPMQILSIAFAFATINMLPGAVYKAINRSDYFLLTSAISLPIIAAVMWIAVPYGIEAVAFGHLVLVFLNYMPNFLILRRVIGVDAAPTVRATLPGLACALGTAAGGLAARVLSPDNAFAMLALTVAGAGAAYLLMLRLMAPEVFRELRRLLDKVRRRRDKRNALPQEPAE